MSGKLRMILAVALGLFALGVAAAMPFQGSFKANGKDAKLAHLAAFKSEPFDGKPVTLLIFSEKDASGNAKPEMNAIFGEFGDALVIKLQQDGDNWDVIGSNFMHSALKHSGASASGVVSIKDAKLANGEISGHLTTRPGEDMFGEPLSVDLTFHVKQP